MMSNFGGATDPSFSEENALKLYQSHLDAVSELILSNQPDQAATYFSYPYRINTAKGETLYETAAEMAHDISNMSDFLRSQGATDYVRLARRAQFLSPHVIEGRHVTHMLRDALNLVPTYQSRLVLKWQTGDRWLGIEADHEISNLAFPTRRMTPAPGLFQERWALSSTERRLVHDDALPIYAAFLKSFDAATNAGDFDAWCQHMTFPCEMHFQTSDLHVAKPEDARHLFDAQRHEVTQPGICGLERRPIRAQFLSADRILGYHHSAWIAEGKALDSPIQSRLVLVVDGDFWRACDFTNTVARADEIGPAFDHSQPLPSLRHIQNRQNRV